MKKLIILLLIVVFCFSGCSSDKSSVSSVSDTSTQPTSVINDIISTEIFDDEVATLDNQVINLNEVNDNIVYITYAGNFVLEGEFNGQIRVEVNDDAQVKLTLSNAKISCDGSACIYFVNGDKLTVSCEEGTENYLINSGSFVQSDGNKVDAAVFAKDDLQISGKGAINVSSEFGHGIAAKDDLLIKNLFLNIDSLKKGIDVKDKAAIKSGTINIKSGSKGIQAHVLDISGGAISINSGDDGLSVSDRGTKDDDSSAVQEGTTLYISDGEVIITAGGDGIDSKGDIFISGGSVVVNAIGQGAGNKALEYNGRCEINGGKQSFPEKP